MPQKLSWSFSGGAPAGPAIDALGNVEVDALTTATVTLEKAMSADRDLLLQIDNVDKLAVFVLTSSLTDGSVDVKTDTTARTKITGPLVFFGEAIKLFAGDLDKISLKNVATDDPADITILMGFKLD